MIGLIFILVGLVCILFMLVLLLLNVIDVIVDMDFNILKVLTIIGFALLVIGGICQGLGVDDAVCLESCEDRMNSYIITNEVFEECCELKYLVNGAFGCEPSGDKCLDWREKTYCEKNPTDIEKCVCDEYQEERISGFVGYYQGKPVGSGRDLVNVTKKELNEYIDEVNTMENLSKVSVSWTTLQNKTCVKARERGICPTKVILYVNENIGEEQDIVIKLGDLYNGIDDATYCSNINNGDVTIEVVESSTKTHYEVIY